MRSFEPSQNLTAAPAGVPFERALVGQRPDDKLLRDPKPYWVINEPYRSREMTLLHKLGVRHMLVGHWHVGETFERDGITWHVAPSTGRLLPWSGQLGFAMHTISREGEVTTEFVPLGVGN